MGILPSAFLLQPRGVQLHPRRASLSFGSRRRRRPRPRPAAHLDLVRGRQHQSRHIWLPRGGVRGRAAKGKGHVRTGRLGAALRGVWKWGGGGRPAADGQTVHCPPGPRRPWASGRVAPSLAGSSRPPGPPRMRGLGLQRAGVLGSRHGAFALREAWGLGLGACQDGKQKAASGRLQRRNGQEQGAPACGRGPLGPQVRSQRLLRPD